MSARRARAGLILSGLALAACGAGGGGPAAPAEPPPDADAFLTVDARATLALKQDLSARFSKSDAAAAIEAALSGDGWSCGPDPTMPSERACARKKDDRGCEMHSVVRVSPWRPDLAQVIRLCAVTPAPK
jgi:DNA-binding transcriptional LysR family regulator